MCIRSSWKCKNEELLRAQKDLEVSRERYFDLYDLAPVGYLTLSSDGRILITNLTAAKLLGFKRDSLIERPLAHFILFADSELYHEHHQRLFETGKSQALELRLVKQDGTQFWARLEATVAKEADGSAECWTIMSDITERKLAEQALQQAYSETEEKVESRTRELKDALAALQRSRAEREHLQQELLRISEREKQIMAQELHDGLCQHLVGTAFMGSLLSRRLTERGAPEAEQAKTICELLNTGVDEARHLSHGLHPVKAEGEGLMEALSQHAETVTKLFHVHCSFRCGSSVVIESQAVATHFFRIAQEAINNSMKHGEATRVFITLASGRSGIVLSIRDNGIGLTTDLPPTRGMGLQIMNHRAETIGAKLEVSHGARGGTVVRCVLPKGH